MDLTDLVKAAGIVGAGGAGFPTHVKLSTKAECFIVNAAECEPLIETDKYLCRTFAERIVKTVDLIGTHLGAERKVIALKAAYETEIAALQEAIRNTGVQVELFPMGYFYPAGDEQTMVQQVTGRSIPERGLPANVGCVVDNVGTVLNIANALEGMVVTEKYLSVVGEVEEPIMLKVPIGTPILSCIQAAKPTIREYSIILGGPMMGRQLTDARAISEAVVTKTTGNIIVLPKEHYLFRRGQLPIDTMKKQAKSACIQCRMCTDLCPRYLIGQNIRPNLIMRNLWRENQLSDTEYGQVFGMAQNCCSCGACELFSCPMGLSPRKINDYLKGQLRNKGITFDRELNPVAKSTVDTRKIPTNRLVARLGLSPYYGRHAKTCLRFLPAYVDIPLSQHIGKPARPIRCVGDAVEKGTLIGEAQEGLSANIHASVKGVIEEINETRVRIRVERRNS